MSSAAARLAIVGVVACGGCRPVPVNPAHAERRQPSRMVVVQDIPAGGLAGQVTNDSGRVIVDAVVRLDAKRYTCTDTLGRFAFDSVAPGRHAFHVYAMGYSGFVGAVNTNGAPTAVTVQLRSEELHLTQVCFGAAHPAIVVVVRNAPRNTAVRIASRTGEQRAVGDSLPVDHDGTLRIFSRAESAGIYEVEVTAPGYERWRRHGIEVRSGPCEIIPAVVVVDLVHVRGSR